MYELRWVMHGKGQPPQGAICIGQPPQIMFQVLQYRTIINPLETGIQEPIWSEWETVPFGE